GHPLIPADRAAHDGCTKLPLSAAPARSGEPTRPWPSERAIRLTLKGPLTNPAHFWAGNCFMRRLALCGCDL
ncbi:hypothetical protein, partial [Acidocella aminolytica]|uniref:hypothetical protein n=1 Tax=Acidocella aminolytica TaxID=33998 RepID=UPI0022315074